MKDWVAVALTLALTIGLIVGWTLLTLTHQFLATGTVSVVFLT